MVDAAGSSNRANSRIERRKKLEKAVEEKV
jgi:hypothetical protein